MKVAVVTPYYRPERSALYQCYQSVKAQTHPCTQIFVADGDPLEIVDKFDALHIKSHGPNEDVGNTARALGSIIAIRQRFDAICYLDADNWYEPHHVAGMIALHRETGSAVCSSARNLCHVDGTFLGLCAECDGESFVDTNCLLLTKDAFPIISVWYSMDRRLDAVGDRVVWFQIKQMGLKTAHSDQPSVNYRTSYRGHYEQLKIAPPPDAKGGEGIKQARRLFEDLRVKALKKQDATIMVSSLDQPLISAEGKSPRHHASSYVLISLIALPRAQIGRVLDDLIKDSLSEGKTPVFMIDEIDLAVEIGKVALVEHLPNARCRDALSPNLDWDLYLSRRLLQLQQKWRSPRIVTFGLPLEALNSSATQWEAYISQSRKMSSGMIETDHASPSAMSSAEISKAQ